MKHTSNNGKQVTSFQLYMALTFGKQGAWTWLWKQHALMPFGKDIGNKVQELLGSKLCTNK